MTTTSILYSLKFWTTKEASSVKDVSIGCSFYHEKAETGGNEGHNYNEEKKNYLQNRGNYWSLSNRRPEKSKERLKEFEDLCAASRCLRVHWKTNHIIQAVFGNGTIVYLLVNVLTGDIEKISFDRHLVGKLHSDHVVDVYQDDSSIIFSYVEPKLTYIQFNKKASFTDSNRKYEKLPALNPRITHVDLSGPSGRRLTRRLVCNMKHNLLMLWWRTSVDEIWPWTPLSSDLERANIHLYNIAGGKLELVAHCRTELEPIIASLSNLHSNQVLTLEQRILHTGEVYVERCVYEIMLAKMERTAIVSIPLKSQVVCQEQNHQEDRILIGCGDGSLVMYDDQRRTSQTGKIPMVPSLISWHPKGSLVLVASKNGCIFCFDQALSTMKFQMMAEDFSLHSSINLPDHLRDSQNRTEGIISDIIWNSSVHSLDSSHSSTLDNAVIVMDRGPFVLINLNIGIFTSSSFTPLELVAQYIKHQQIDEAVNLLNSMNWNLNGDACFYVLTRIVNALFRLPLTEDREAQIENSIGTFYAPIRPLTKATILQYRDRIRNLARRFFHHLLRFGRLQKASLLAVDIGAVDLFKDLYYTAMEKGDHMLAEVALRNMEGLDDSFASETDTEESQDGDAVEEYSESSYSTDSSEPVGEQRKISSVANARYEGSKYATRAPTTKFAQATMEKSSGVPSPPPTYPTKPSETFAGHSQARSRPVLQSLSMMSLREDSRPTRSNATTNPAAVRRAVETGKVWPKAQEAKLMTGDRSVEKHHHVEEPSSFQLHGEEKFVDGNPSSAGESEDEQLGMVQVMHFGVV